MRLCGGRGKSWPLHLSFLIDSQFPASFDLLPPLCCFSALSLPRQQRLSVHAQACTYAESERERAKHVKEKASPFLLPFWRAWPPLNEQQYPNISRGWPVRQGPQLESAQSIEHGPCVHSALCLRVCFLPNLFFPARLARLLGISHCHLSPQHEKFGTPDAIIWCPLESSLLGRDSFGL